MRKTYRNSLVVLACVFLVSGCLEPKLGDGKIRTSDDGIPVRTAKTSKLTKKSLGKSPEQKRLPQASGTLLQPGEMPVVPEGETAPSAPTGPQVIVHDAKPQIIRNPEVEARRERIKQLILNPDPTAMGELQKILFEPYNVHSALAALAIRQIGGIDAEQALEKALADPRPQVRQTALNSLLDMKAPGILERCRKIIRSDGDPRMRTAAAIGIGKERDRESIEILRQILIKDAPNVRYASAWALARMGDPVGVGYLTQIALADDQQVSPQAITALGSIKDRTVVLQLYKCLNSRHESIRNAALDAINGIPDREIIAGLSSLPESQRLNLDLRRKMLSCLAGKGKMPVECLILVERGNRQEKLMALRCIETAGGINTVPVAVSALGDSDGSVQIAAASSLQSMIKRLKLPGMRGSDDDWESWWFSQFYVFAAREKEAILLSPAGEKIKVIPGSLLDWGAAVVRIVPGTGSKYREGATVYLTLDRRQFQLNALPE